MASQLKLLPKEVKSFAGYNVITEKVSNMGVLLPLVSSLYSEYMEKRQVKDTKLMKNQKNILLLLYTIP